MRDGELSLMTQWLTVPDRVGFCHGKEYFCQDSGKIVKTTVKIGNKFSILNWIEMFLCKYNASLNH